MRNLENENSEAKIYSFNMYDENNEKIFSDFMNKSDAQKMKAKLKSKNLNFEIWKLDEGNDLIEVDNI